MWGFVVERSGGLDLARRQQTVLVRRDATCCVGFICIYMSYTFLMAVFSFLVRSPTLQDNRQQNAALAARAAWCCGVSATRPALLQFSVQSISDGRLRSKLPVHRLGKQPRVRF